MDRWGQGQLRLFEQLAQICDAVGETKALAIAPATTETDHHGLFTLELEQLRARAAWADELEGMTGRLQTALEDSNARLRALLEEAGDNSPSGARPKQEGLSDITEEARRNPGGCRPTLDLHDGSGDERRTTSSRSNNPMAGNDNGQPDGLSSFMGPEIEGENVASLTISSLERKYEQLSTNHRELKEARDILEGRLRKKIKGERAWMDYAKKLELKLERVDNTKCRIEHSPQMEEEALHPTSSSTQGEEELPSMTPAAATVGQTMDIKNEPLSDEPVVVSSKMVRKRNAVGTATPIVSSSLGNVKPEKLENDSPTSPVGMARLGLLAHTDSIDLDDLGRHFTTPKKTRLLRTAAEANAEAKTESNTTKKSSIQASRARNSTTTPSHSVSGHHAAALQPRSPNKIVLPRTSNVLSSKKRRRIDEDAIRELGGDAENDGCERPAEALPYTPLQRNELKRRLGGLLDVPSVPRSALAIDKYDAYYNNSSPLVKGTDNGKSVGNHRTQSVLLGTKNTSATPDSALQKSSTTKRRTSSKQAIASTSFDADPEQEPCRARPIQRLGLQDFKLNPKHGGGQAYSDVVRGKEQRKCLPGCIDPQCCGPVFREMAVLARDSAPLSAAQRDADWKILVEYLGKDVGRLKTATKAEREELLLQAHTKDFSKKFGKHRHSFGRARSPPNFWDTGFPSTQEEQDIRTRVREVERQLVHKRYNEALRGNEQWIFRDE